MLLLGHDEDRVCYWRLASHRAKARKMTAQWWGYRIYGGITSQQALPDASISLIWFSLSCLPTLLLLKHNRLNAEDNRHTRGQRPIYHLANLKARALWLLRRSRQSSGSSSCLSPLGSFFQMQIRAGMVRACKPVVNLDLKADKYRRTTTGFFVGQKKRKERTGTH